jgi:hypothetical protein
MEILVQVLHPDPKSKDLLEMNNSNKNSNLQQGERLRGLVAHPQWLNFVEYLNYLQEQQYRILEQSDKQPDMYRAQGFVDALKRIKSLEHQLK